MLDQGVKFLTKLQLKFSHLNEHKFCLNFKDCMSPMCDCCAETKVASQFFLRYQLFVLKDKNSMIMFIGWMPQLKT